MSGMARSYMNDVCGSANALWSIQDGKVNVVPETAYMPGSVPVISHETGLVGMPEQAENGNQAAHAAQSQHPRRRADPPGQQPHRRIRLPGAGAKRDGGKKAEAEVDRSEQRKISSDGYYYVMVVEHRGNTRGGDWYTDVLCVATDATLYPGDLGRPAPAAAMARPPTSSSRRRAFQMTQAG